MSLPQLIVSVKTIHSILVHNMQTSFHSRLNKIFTGSAISRTELPVKAQIIDHKPQITNHKQLTTFENAHRQMIDTACGCWRSNFRRSRCRKQRKEQCERTNGSNV